MLLVLGDSISTDEIMPAGSALGLRSNVPALAEHYFAQVDEDAYDRAMKLRDEQWPPDRRGQELRPGILARARSADSRVRRPPSGDRQVVRADSRAEPRQLRGVAIAVLDLGDHDAVTPDTVLRIDDVHDAIRTGEPFDVHRADSDESFRVRHELSPRQIDVVLAGGLINAFQSQKSTGGEPMPPRGVKKGTKRARQYERIRRASSTAGPASAARRRSRRGQ